MAFKEQIGLGIVLDFDNRGDREIRATRNELRGMRTDATMGIRALHGEMDALSSQLKSAQKGLNITRTAAIGLGTAAIGLGTIMTREAIQAEHLGGQIEALFVGQGKSFEQAEKSIVSLENTIRRAGRFIPIANDRFRASAYDLVSALGEVNAEAAIIPTGMLAIAGRANDIQDATELMTQVQLTFGEQWSDLTPLERSMKIFEQTAAAVAIYKTDVTKLAKSLEQAAPMQTALGRSYAESIALIGSLQSRGLGSERAGTAISMMIQQFAMIPEKLEKLKKEMGRKELSLENILGLDQDEVDSDLLRFAEIRFTDEEGFMRPVTAILKDFGRIIGVTPQIAQEVNEAVAKSLEEGESTPEAETEKILRKHGIKLSEAGGIGKLVGAEAARGIMLAIPAAFQMEEDIKLIEKGGVGTAMFEAAASTTQSNLQILSNNLESVAIVIGDGLLPPLNSVIDVLNDILVWLQEHPGTARALGWGALGGGVLGSAGLGALAFRFWKRIGNIEKNLGSVAKAMSKEVGNAFDEGVKILDRSGRPIASSADEVARTAAGAAAKTAGGTFARTGARLLGRAAKVAGPVGVAIQVGEFLHGAQISAKESDYLRAMTEGPLTQEQYKNLGRMPTVEEYRQTLLANAPELLDFIYGGPGAEAPWTTRMQVPETYEGLVGQTTYISFGDISIDARGADGEEIYDTLMQKAADAKERGVDEKF